MYDIVIKNAALIDGSGKRSKKSDLAIKGDKIAKIGQIHPQDGKITIDADGMVLAPGFVDILNHADTKWTLFEYPSQESLLRQGITTIIGGNCGSSLAPLIRGEALLSIQKWADIDQVNVNWQSFEELMEELGQKKIGVNFGSLVGHATIRRGLLNDEIRDIAPDELNKMKYLIEKSIAEGAFGLSMGLAFAHARNAKKEELIELAATVKKSGGYLASHLRNDKEKFSESFNEVMEIAKSAGVSFELSHFKAGGKNAQVDIEVALEKINKANKEGANIKFDFFPYDFSASVLYTILPEWVTEGGKHRVLDRLKNKDVQRIVMEDVRLKGIDFKDIIIATANITKNYVGKSISDIALREGISPEEMLIHLLIANDDKVIAFFKNYYAKNLKKLVLSPHSIFVSDGFGADREMIKEGVLTHPRCFNSFTKFIEDYVVAEKIITTEEAIYKMSGAPAEKIGIKQRGFLREGYFADLTLFKPENLKNRASIENPFIFPDGMEYVLVNGKIAVSRQKYTGAMSGKILRK